MLQCYKCLINVYLIELNTYTCGHGVEGQSGPVTSEVFRIPDEKSPSMVSENCLEALRLSNDLPKIS